MENMTLDDPESAFDEVSFRNDESTRKYIDTAISRNIQNTLKNDHYVLYRGENKLAGDVEYQNTEQFLCDLA